MNVRMEGLSTLVADLVGIRAQQAALAEAEGRIIATLRESVSPDDVPAFREQYGSMVVPALVQGSAIPALPVVDWITYADHLNSWPLRGSLILGCPIRPVRDLIDVVGTQRIRLDVPFTPILGQQPREREDALRLLIAAPTPTVAAALRDAGDPRFAAFGRSRVDFRKPPTRGDKGTDDE